MLNFSHKPTKEDQQKLNSEVTLIANQRFIWLTILVVMFGTIFGPVSREFYKQPDAGNIRAFLCTLGVYLLILWAISWHNNRLLERLRVYTTYLIETGSSQWEQDWFIFRRLHYKKYASIDLSAHAWLFLVLIFVPQIFLLLIYVVSNYNYISTNCDTLAYYLTLNKFLEFGLFICSMILFFYIWSSANLKHWEEQEGKIMCDWKGVLSSRKKRIGLGER